MNPATHFLASWVAANSSALTPRGRLAVTLAGVIPDLDGLGAIPDLVACGFGGESVLFDAWHHTFGHGLPFAVAVSAGLAVLASGRPGSTGPLKCSTAVPKGGRSRECVLRLKLFILCMISFHLHLLMDLVGARGPDGYTWPIPYLYPFSGPILEWSGQWELNAWPNFLITGILLAAALRIAWKSGATPIELFFPRAGERIVDTLKNRFGEPDYNNHRP